MAERDPIQWARGTLNALDLPDPPAQVRLRLEPSPVRGAALALVPWRGAATADDLADVATRRLAELGDQAGGRKLRLEPLNGAGEPMCSKAMRIPMPTLPAVIDVEPEPVPPRRGSPLEALGALAGQAGGQLVEVPVAALLYGPLAALEAVTRALETTTGRLAGMADRVNGGTDSLRRAIGGTLDHKERTSRDLLDYARQAAVADAEVRLAQLGAELEREKEQKPAPGKWAQVTDLLKSSTGLLSALRPAAGGGAASAPASQAEAEAEADDESGLLSLLLSLPPAEAAGLIQSTLAPDQLVKLSAILGALKGGDADGDGHGSGAGGSGAAAAGDGQPAQRGGSGPGPGPGAGGSDPGVAAAAAV